MCRFLQNTVRWKPRDFSSVAAVGTASFQKPLAILGSICPPVRVRLDRFPKRKEAPPHELTAVIAVACRSDWIPGLAPPDSLARATRGRGVFRNARQGTTLCWTASARPAGQSQVRRGLRAHSGGSARGQDVPAGSGTAPLPFDPRIRETSAIAAIAFEMDSREDSHKAVHHHGASVDTTRECSLLADGGVHEVNHQSSSRHWRCCGCQFPPSVIFLPMIGSANATT
jgi:hypothetical protein